MNNIALVDCIQALFPPKGMVPPPESGRSRPAGLADVEPTDRHRLPDGSMLSDSCIPMPMTDVLTVEEPMPIVQANSGVDIDLLAYYLPFHFYDAKKWGIHLRASGILAVASLLGELDKAATYPDSLRLAKAILLRHERFHFVAELACSRAEIVTGGELYRHYYHDRFAASVEEALSNAYVLAESLVRENAPLSQGLKEWMRNQGAGYRNFEAHLASRNFRMGTSKIMARMLGVEKYLKCSKGTISSGRTGFVGSYVIRDGVLATCLGISTPIYDSLFDGLARARPPVYLIRDVPGLNVLRPFAKHLGLRVLVHTHDHKPPHIHIELPPGTNYTRLEWPSLKPLPGNRRLPSRKQKDLDAYMNRYGSEVGKKVLKVYS